jgi:isocitrate dehydrogenase kinase/phosphatase
MPTDVNLSEFFHTKIKETIKKKYPREYTDNLTEEEFEGLLLRLVHDNDMNLKWENASAYGGSVDSHLEFQTGLEVKQSAQKVDKFLAPFAKTKWAS